MKKLLAIFVSAALFLFPMSAVAAVKAGAACSKLGATSISAGKKFTCIKIGKKLVWDKGVATIQIVEPKNLEAAVTNYSQVPYWAHKKSSDLIAKSPAKQLNYSILVGPNTKPINEVPQIAINAVAKMFPNFNITKDFVIIYFNFADRAWAQAKFDSLIGNTAGYDVTGEVNKACPTALACDAAAQVTNRETGSSILIITASDNKKNDRHFNSGTMEAHEFFHSYQNSLFFGTNKASNQLPRWLLEGSASFVELASVYSGNLNNYLINKGNLLVQLHYQKGYKEEDLIKFLDAPSLGTDWSSWDSYNPQRVYDIGLLATEIMVAVAGPESILEQYKLVAGGMSYKQAFEKVFGISWDAGVKLLAKAIAKETS